MSIQKTMNSIIYLASLPNNKFNVYKTLPFKVHQHKTKGTYGPQNISLDETLNRWMEIYVRLGRPVTPSCSLDELKDEMSPLFLDRGCHPITRVAQTLQR